MLKGSRALITGSESGIGLALARKLVQDEGVELLMVCKDLQAGIKAASSLAGKGKGRVLRVLPLDLRKGESIQNLVDHVASELDQQLNILVNNAAVFEDGWSHEVYDTTLRTNFKGPVELTQGLAPHMAPSAGIVMTSSGFAHLDFLTPDYIERVTQATSLDDLWERCKAFDPESAMGKAETHVGKLSSWGTAVPAYKVSKAMVDKAVQLLSQDPLLHQRGIAVVAADPGWCRTAMGGPDADRTPDDGADALLQGIKQALKCAI